MCLSLCKFVRAFVLKCVQARAQDSLLLASVSASASASVARVQIQHPTKRCVSVLLRVI